MISSALLAVAGARAGAQESTRCNLIPQPTTRYTADSVSGATFVGGGVHIECPSRSIELRGDSAERYPDRDYVIGHVIYDEPRLHMTSDYLTYFLTDQRVVATSDVHARLPNGSTLVGPVATYLRADPKTSRHEQLIATGRPTIQIVEKDSTGKPQPPLNVVADHLFMDNTDSLIYGGGQVVITRPDLGANADSAFIDEPHETMHLMRNPRIAGKKEHPFTLTGNLIDLFSHDQKLQRVIARANAVAVSDSLTLKSDTIDLRLRDDTLNRAYAWGAKSRASAVSPSQRLLADSLDVLMPHQRVSLVRAVRKAYAQGKPDTVRFKVEKPDTTDWLLGDTIIAHFDTTPPKNPRDTAQAPEIRQLVANGHASAYYHLAPSDSSEHRPAINYVKARVVTIDFDQQKVATVTTVDSVVGMYIDPVVDSTARKQRNAAGQTNAKNANGKVPTSIVPLPPKRPPSPSSPSSPPLTSPSTPPLRPASTP